MADNVSRTIKLNVIGDSSGAQQALKKVGDESEHTKGRVGAAFTGMFSSLSAASGGAFAPIEEAFAKVREASEGIAEGGLKVGKVMMATGAAAVGVGAILTAAGSKDQQAQQQLRQAIENTGGSYEDFKDKIEQTNGSMAKYGYTASQSMNALQQLTQATKDPAKALDMMGLAANLAAARHESLDQATLQLSQVIAGKGTRVLQQLGIQHIAAAKTAQQLTAATKAQEQAQTSVAAAQQKLSDLEAIDHGKKTLTIADHIALRNAQDAVTAAQGKLATANRAVTQAQDATKTSGDNVQQMLAEVSQAVNGQASAAADTWKGKLEAVKAEVENQVATLGQKYGPAITAAGAGMSALGGAASAASAVMGHFRQAQEGAAVATDALAASETAELVPEGLALAPILLIIAAIALLGVGIYELVTHWKTVWTDVKAVMSDAWHFITDAVSSVVGFVKDHFNQIVSFVEGLPGRIASAAEHMWDSIGSAFKGVVNYVIGLWDDLSAATVISIPSVHIPGIGTIGGGNVGPLVPQIPMLAAGGIVSSPTLAMIGEAGPEAVVPLPSGGGYGAGGGVADVYLDGRLVGHAVAAHVRDNLLTGTARNSTRVGLA